MTQPIKTYRFGAGISEGNSDMKDLLGGKAANLCEMALLGIPVPPGYTFPTTLCLNKPGADAIEAAISEGDTWLAKHFGYQPLVSVRSGARVSMPGMMDTILNVGLCDANLKEWGKRIGERAALDSYRRLIQMFSSVVRNIPMKEFDDILKDFKASEGVEADSDLNAETLKKVIEAYKGVYENHCGKPFPQDRVEQIRLAVYAVFESWDNPRAQEYRKINAIPYEWGTAATVQSMVFGNMNDQSATGVLFSRNPSNGEKKVTGEWLINAQGEDVVAGIRTPFPLHEMGEAKAKGYGSGWGGPYHDLMVYVGKLEQHYKDMQDIEFTVQDGKLYLLQTRNGKRSARAAFQIAYDMANEGLITKEQAVARITTDQLLTMMRPTIDPAFKTPPHLMGIAAGGGVVTGVAVFTSADAINCTEPCILIREETDPDDIGGMNAAVGILTATGGLTSHAAVVARGMDKTCVVGATDLEVTEHGAHVKDGAGSIKKGDKVTIDGTTGKVWFSTDVPVVDNNDLECVKALCRWAAAEGTPERIDSTMDGVRNALATATAPIVQVDACMGQSWDMAYWTEVAAGAKQCKAERIIIDLCPIQNYYKPADDVYDWMFSRGSVNQPVANVSAIALCDWGSAKSRVAFKLAPNVPLTVRVKLKEKGFKVQGSIATVQDLIDAEEDISITDEVIDNVFGSASAFQVVKSLLGKKEGKTILPAQYWFESIMNKGA